LRDYVRTLTGVVVAALEQEPLGLEARAAGALQGEAAAQLLPVQDEDRVAAVQRLRPRDAAALLVRASRPV